MSLKLDSVLGGPSMPFTRPRLTDTVRLTKSISSHLRAISSLSRIPVKKTVKKKA